MRLLLKKWLVGVSVADDIGGRRDRGANPGHEGQARARRDHAAVGRHAGPVIHDGGSRRALAARLMRGVRSAQRGTAAMEYLAVTAFGVIMLVTPFDGGNSVIARLVRGFQDYYGAYSYAMSVTPNGISSSLNNGSDTGNSGSNGNKGDNGSGSSDGNAVGSGPSGGGSSGDSTGGGSDGTSGSGSTGGGGDISGSGNNDNNNNGGGAETPGGSSSQCSSTT